MKILDLSLSTDPNIALFTSGTIDFLQLAYKEGIAAAIINQIGVSYDSGTVYCLYGCQSSIVSGNKVIASGALFYNGEFFIANGNTLSGTTGTIITNLLISPYTTALGGDPMTFTVSGTANVHNIRTADFAYGTSGDGTLSGDSASDYSDIIFLQRTLTVSSITNHVVIQTPLFRNNIVYFTGKIHTNFPGPGSVTGDLFTLDEGFRPLHDITQNCWSSFGTYIVSVTIIAATGVVSTTATINGSTNYIDVSNISFPTV